MRDYKKRLFYFAPLREVLFFFPSEGLIPSARSRVRALGRFFSVFNPIPYKNKIPCPFRAGLLISSNAFSASVISS